MLGRLKQDRGFTLVEMLMVFIIFGILAQISLTFMIDLRKRAHDAVAITDGRNLINTVRNNFVNLDDVDYAEIDDSSIGVKTVGGADRPPIFTLSPGVKIVVVAGSKSPGVPDQGSFIAWLYHEAGTDDPMSATGSGKREFYYVADETSVPPTYSLATF